MQLANEIQKCPVVFGYTLYTTAPIVIIECPPPLKWILKVLHWISVCGAWFQTLLAKSIWWGRCAAKGAPLGASLTWTPPSWANHNTASCQKGKGVLTIIQTLPFHIVFGKSFPPHFFFFGSICLFIFVCAGHSKSLSVWTTEPTAVPSRPRAGAFSSAEHCCWCT